MQRHVLSSACLLSILSCSIYSISFADGMPTSTYCKPGFYVGILGAWTDTYYHPNEIFTPAVANNGGATGIETTSVNNSTFTNSQLGLVAETSTEIMASFTNTGLHDEENDIHGLGGRIYAGYQFMPYFAAELGFTQFAKSTFSATGISTTYTNDTTFTRPSLTANNAFISDPSIRPTIDNTVTWTNTTTQYNADLTEQAIDLVAKGTLPLPYGFGAYLKAGMAYITAERDINSHVTGSSSNSSSTETTIGFLNTTTVPTASDTSFSNVDTFGTIFTDTYQEFRPTAGIGLDYTIPESNFDVEISYDRIFGSDNIDNADLLALGVNYKFA